MQGYSSTQSKACKVQLCFFWRNAVHLKLCSCCNHEHKVVIGCRFEELKMHNFRLVLVLLTFPISIFQNIRWSVSDHEHFNFFTASNSWTRRDRQWARTCDQDTRRCCDQQAPIWQSDSNDFIPKEEDLGRLLQEQRTIQHAYPGGNQTPPRWRTVASAICIRHSFPRRAFQTCLPYKASCCHRK